MSAKDELCQQARALWLCTTTTDIDEESSRPETTTSSRMKRVEELYQSAWDNDMMMMNHHQTNHNNDGDTNNNDDDDDTVRMQEAGEKLAMIWLQSGRTQQADAILQTLGYSCRLASRVLNYPTTTACDDKQQVETTSSSIIPCRIYDNFLSHAERRILCSVFENPAASYWTFHQYSVEPPSPYVSYLIPLTTTQQQQQDNDTTINKHSFLYHLVHRLQKFVATNYKPAVLEQARYCELWAHNRPHASGHQLHFDSDNEGDTGGVIRNPIVSTILYLSDNNVGGPSLVTNQRLTSRSLADRGWLCQAKPGRLVAFNGKVLHGVLPGKGEPTAERRRVTVMLAFWKDIQERPVDGIHGAAKPFPSNDEEWAKLLLQPYHNDTISSSSSFAGENAHHDGSNSAVGDHATATTTDDDDATTSTTARTCTAVDPIALDCVYERVDNGKPWTRSMGLPEYDQVFQGF